MKKTDNQYDVISFNSKVWSLDTMSHTHLMTYALRKKDSGKLFIQFSQIFQEIMNDKERNSDLNLYFTISGKGKAYLIDLNNGEHLPFTRQDGTDDELYCFELKSSEYTKEDLDNVINYL